MPHEPELSRIESNPTWTCPEIRPLTPQGLESATRLYADIAEDKTLPTGPIGSAGLELRVALMLMQEEERFSKPDNSFWKRKCRSLFLRPAVEPIACAYWSRLVSFEIDDALALKMASAMAGQPLVYRKGAATGRSDNGDVQFGPLESARHWLAEITRIANTPELRTALPAYCFAQTIMTHPFSDGNGRFGRLMVHAALGRCAGLTGPKIALAPAFYRRGEALALALTALSQDGDWSEFNRVFLSALDDAVTFTRSLYREEALQRR